MIAATHAPKRRGFAMIVAIAVLGLVAVAATLVGRLARDDAMRNVRERDDAQARMLLLAGLRVASTELTAGRTPTTGPLAVPAEVDASLAISAVETPAPDRAIVTITTGTLAQRATFIRGAGGAWTLDRATIAR